MRIWITAITINIVDTTGIMDGIGITDIATVDIVITTGMDDMAITGTAIEVSTEAGKHSESALTGLAPRHGGDGVASRRTNFN
jgi:hypothetical protein